jgi:GntR family transcriptional regulator, transcriptional repressor for pyruvate dehydrogenase complex
MAEERPSPQFRALEQRRTFEQIIFQVEEAILSGELKSGDRLPSERDLAETFGVSRASVREALRVLEMFGVVIARRGTGASAGSILAANAQNGLESALRLHTALSKIPTEDIVDLRAVLEGHAARRAAMRPAPRDTGVLRDIIEAMRVADEPESYNGFDTDFHVELARVSGNKLAPVLMEALRGTVVRDMIRGFAALGDWKAERDRLVTEHTHIVDLIEQGDGEAAAGAVEAHIFRFYRGVFEESKIEEGLKATADAQAG